MNRSFRQKRHTLRGQSVRRRLGSVGRFIVAACLSAGCSQRAPAPYEGALAPEAGLVDDTGASQDYDGSLPTDAGAESDAAIVDAGFSSDGGSDRDAGDLPDPHRALFELTGLDDFATLAAAGSEVKYLLESNAAELPASLPSSCVFQNTDVYPYHLQFLNTLPGFGDLSAERYEDWVLWRATRALYAGVIKLFAATAHPDSGKLGVLAYSVYAADTAGERLTAAEVISVHRLLSGCAPTLADFLIYMPTTAAELQSARSYADAFSEAGVVFMAPSDLNADLRAEVYTPGEAYGFLRYAPEGAHFDEFGPHDVLLTGVAPSDLGLVAALVTKNPQSGVSHLNLRLREKGIPSASAPQAFDASLLQQLNNQLVHVVAQGTQVTIEPAHRADAEEHWRKTHVPLEAPPADLTVTAVAPLSELRHDDADVYGTKAANLGEINRILPQHNVVHGLAIPFAAYADHMRGHDLQPDVDALADMGPGSSDTSAALSALRDKIRAAPVSQQWEDALLDQVQQVWGATGLVTRLRFRSSTNAEDLPGLSGAGLYDSASGCLADDLDGDETGPSACLTDLQRAYYESELSARRDELRAHPEREHLQALVKDLEDELTKEKSARRALRKVWASLWNRRAFEDRQYYGIDHHDVHMAVAVHPAFVGERLEAVVVTNLEPGSDAPYYRVESQRGEVGVVRPNDPNAVAEQLRFRRGPEDTAIDVTLVSPSSLSADGASLWHGPLLDELAARVFQLHDAFSQHVYPDLSPLQLDIEVDVTHDGQVVFKQARPY